MSEIKELKKEIIELRNEIAQLRVEIKMFMNSQTVTYPYGTYTWDFDCYNLYSLTTNEDDGR